MLPDPLSLWPFIGSAVFYVLLKLGFYCLGILLLRHPLCAGLVLWLITGDFNLLLAAVFFELLWLDLFYVGTFVPPDNLFAYLLFAPLMLTLGLGQPQDICALLLATLPFAALMGKLESRLRLGAGAGYKKLNQVVDEGGDVQATASAVIRKSLARLALLDVSVYALAALLLYGGVSLWLWEFGSVYRIGWASWGFLICLAALGGVLSLRITWARVCFGACVLVVGGIYVFY